MRYVQADEHRRPAPPRSTVHSTHLMGRGQHGQDKQSQKLEKYQSKVRLETAGTGQISPQTHPATTMFAEAGQGNGTKPQGFF